MKIRDMFNRDGKRPSLHHVVQSCSLFIAFVMVLASVAVTGAQTAHAAAADSSDLGSCAAATAAYNTAQATALADAKLLTQEQAQLTTLNKQLDQLEAQITANQSIVNQHDANVAQLNHDLDVASNDISQLTGVVVNTVTELPVKAPAVQLIKAGLLNLETKLQGYSAFIQGTLRTLVVQQGWGQFSAQTFTIVTEVSVSMTVELSTLAALATTSLNFVLKAGILAQAAKVTITLDEYAAYSYGAAHIASQLQQSQSSYDAAVAALKTETAQETTLQNSIKEEQDAINFLDETIDTDDAAVQSALQQEAAACSAPTPLQPPSGGGSQAASTGDPHLVTFDGARYDFQQVGEFVLTKSTVDDFQIQVRQQPWAGTSCSVAENSAVAFSIGGQTVSVYAENPGLSTLVNGNPVSLTSGNPYSLPGGGTITNNSAAAQETVVWPNGSTATVGYGGGFYLALNVTVAASEQGHLVGLLGTDGGNVANDLVTSTGTVLPYPAIATDTSTLYGTFASGWRLTPADSLFTYGTGQSTASFTNTAFPCQVVNLGTLSSAALSSATTQCEAAGVTQEPFLDGCVLDVAVTGDSTVAGSDAQAETIGLGSTTATGTQSITLASGTGTIGSPDPNVTVEDSCAGTTAQATIVAPDPGEWAAPITGTQWDSVNSGLNGCNETFTTTFTLPAGAVNPTITVNDLADNSANVSLNSNQPFITGNVVGQCEADFNGAPMSGATSSGLVTGVNTLTFAVDNCYPADGESPTGIDFSATVTYSTAGS